jgi:hypothetical protein
VTRSGGENAVAPGTKRGAGDASGGRFGGRGLMLGREARLRRAGDRDRGCGTGADAAVEVSGRGSISRGG